MANLYFNNTVNTSLSTLGNWWQDDAFTIPASALPTASDDIHIAAFSGDPLEENVIRVEGGTVVCNGGDIYGLINGGTFDNSATLNVYHYPLGFTLTDPIFTGVINGRCVLDSINASGAFYGEAIIVNWIVAYAFSMFHYKLAFPDWATVMSHGLADIITPGCAVSWDGGTTYYYPPTNQDVAGPEDVRQGANNLGQTGTLGGGTLSITVE
jgi:hypothetical protein